MVIRVELEAVGDSTPAASLETQDVEPTGKFVGETSLDPAEGAAFGIAAEVQGDDLIFAAVNDDTNTLEVFDIEL